jgi:hypothetical protein
VMRVLSPSVIRIWWHDTIPVWTGIIRRHFLCVTGPPSPLRPGSRFGVRLLVEKSRSGRFGKAGSWSGLDFGEWS